MCRIFNLLCLPHRRWESAHEAQQLPEPYGRLRRGREKSMWEHNLNRRLSSGISIVTQQHAYHESLSNVPEGFFSQDYTIKASLYHSVVLILEKKIVKIKHLPEQHIYYYRKKKSNNNLHCMKIWPRSQSLIQITQETIFGIRPFQSY